MSPEALQFTVFFSFQFAMQTITTPAIRENASRCRGYTPSLESRDVLIASEYWRRYCPMPEKVRTKRINQKLCIMSPLRDEHHGNPYFLLVQWIGHCTTNQPLLIGSDNATIRLNNDNDSQPDLCFLRAGVQTHFDEDGFIIDSPEMIVEIAGSPDRSDFREKRDRHEATRGCE